jgi:hypothetical protein
MQRAAASWWAARAADGSHRAARRGWIGDGALDRAVGEVWRFSCGCDRPARRSQRGCAQPMAAMKSTGRGPRRIGQACVFCVHPQARRACLAAGSSKRDREGTIAKAALRPQPLVEAVRG